MATALFTLILPAVFSQEGDWIVASFPDLDVTSQGRTRDEAKRNLIEAAQLFVESCFERNVLDEVLKGCGFTLAHGAREQPEDGEHLTVPVELLVAHNGSAAHTG
jgi:predicted RNase H-like HicB family nuclease